MGSGVSAVEEQNVADAEAKMVKPTPTLFIGPGGTGAEVLMRLRRRIVSEFWSKKRGRLDTVCEIPQCTHFAHRCG